MFVRILKWGGMVIVIVIDAFVVWQKNRAEPFVPMDFDKYLETPRSPREVERYTEQLQEAYAQGTYGGDTPETV